MARNGSEDMNHSIKDRDVPDYPLACSFDRDRPPQLNKDNCVCGCGCKCSGYTHISDGDGVITGLAVDHTNGSNDNIACTSEGAAHDADEAGSDISLSFEHDAIHGDQGVEGHLIEVGDLGVVSLNMIHRALARHDRCTCHYRVPPNSRGCDLESFASPIISGMLPPAAGSPDSMAVEHSSNGDFSMSSSQVLSVGSPSPSAFLGFMGQGPDIDRLYQPIPFADVFRPLLLTHERAFCQNLQIGVHYPLDLSESDFADYDLW